MVAALKTSLSLVGRRDSIELSLEDPVASFRWKLHGGATTPWPKVDGNGNPYMGYHLHYQARLSSRSNIKRTTLRMRFLRPSGKFSEVFNDSYNRRMRADPKPYYAHFKALRIKPGTKIS